MTSFGLGFNKLSTHYERVKWLPEVAIGISQGKIEIICNFFSKDFNTSNHISIWHATKGTIFDSHLAFSSTSEVLLNLHQIVE